MVHSVAIVAMLTLLCLSLHEFQVHFKTMKARIAREDADHKA
jgi:hypothetical protein